MAKVIKSLFKDAVAKPSSGAPDGSNCFYPKDGDWSIPVVIGHDLQGGGADFLKEIGVKKGK